MRKCSECEYFENFRCTRTTRKNNGISLQITTSPQWCPFKKKARKNRKKSPRARLVKELDALARQVCLLRANYKCEISGQPHHTLHAHHIISRSNYRVRWNPDNLACLTPGAHTLYLFSAHKNPGWFLDKMVAKRGSKWYNDLQHEANINAGVAKHTIQDLRIIRDKLKGELDGE